MSSLSLSLLVLAFTVSISEADYEFSIHFYEFRNHLGLQCGECGSGGPPACCDDVNRTENCINEVKGPLRCDTRFRFTLRPFGASVETAPDRHFPHYNAGNFIPNSITFTEKFQNLPNPYTITNATEWAGRVQFFIDALDRVVPHRSDLETEAIINRFRIDIELELGANFTNRATYTGVYNILSSVEFDMSFRVQCSENYYGPNCTTFCTPVKDVYNCSREGSILCHNNHRNPATNCSTCLPQFTREYYCSGGTELESDVALLAGTVGGAGAILIVILLMLCVVIVLVVKMKKRGKYCNTTMKEETYYYYDDVSTKNSQTLQLQMKAATVDTSNAHDHDFDNPLYAEPDGKDSATIELKNGNQMQSSSTRPRCGVTAPMEYKYHNVHSSCTVVPDAPNKGDTTITMITHNEYDIIERCNTTSSTLPAEVPKPNNGAIYSNDSMVQSKPVEGEMYNVAYPVLIPKADSSAASVDGYESLSNVY